MSTDALSEVRDARPFNPLLDLLPRLIRVGPDELHASNSLLDQFIRFATAEMGNKRAGSQSVLNRLSELMFVEVVRLQMDSLRTTIQAGSRGCGILVGRALTLLHGRPTDAWTLEELASEARRIPLVLADRFAHLVGYPPIQYLTQWRMQMAAKRLADPGVSIASVVYEVGYELEAAFSRAFKAFKKQSAARQANGGKGSV